MLIPIYNVEKYLHQCLDSIVNQTLHEIQIICLNDGSTDDSPKIINEYANRDPRIKVINKKNSGYGDSMNRGLAAARGEYIGIVESDDFIELDAFEKLYNLAKEYDADVVRGNYYHFKDGKNKKYKYINIGDTHKLVDPAKTPWIFYQAPAIWSAIYKLDFIKENNISFLPTPGASYQDTGFNFKVWASTQKAVFTEATFLHYRLDNESSSVNNPGKVFNVCNEYAEIEKYLKKNNLYERFKKILQATKFGAYYWNIYRLSPKLRGDFVDKIRVEFISARNDGLLDQSFFPDKKQWKVLNYIINNDTQDAIRYINRAEQLTRFSSGTKRRLKNLLTTVNPLYRKQLEINKLINELYDENAELKSKLDALEHKIEK